MTDKLHKLLLQISPLHESRIEKILIEENPDLDKLLDLSQEIINRERYNANDTASIMHSASKAYAETSIPQLQTVQRVILKLKSQPEQSDRPDQKLIALFYFGKDEQITTENMDQIAQRYGYDSTTSGKKIKDLYNRLSKDPVYYAEQTALYRSELKKMQ